MANIIRKSQAVTLAPNDITKQGLLDCLSEAAKGVLMEDGKPFDYHFLAIHISELANFMSKYDIELAGLLTDLYDCGPFNDEKKRSGAGKMIPFPGLSMIVGTATKNLGATISEEMWGSGFMARVLMVFSSHKVLPDDIFEAPNKDDALEESITNSLRRIGEFRGPMIWTGEARRILNDFMKSAAQGGPLHVKLENYATRRWLQFAKLCMVAALSHERMGILEEDCHTALSWLQRAEADMVEIFKDMTNHTDGAIYEESRMHFFGTYMITRKPVAHSEIVQWLAKRVSVHSVPRMIDILLSADYFKRVAGTSGDDALYIPQPPHGDKGGPRGVI